MSDRYLAEHVKHFNKPSTAKDMRRIIEKHIKPAFGSLKTEAVTRDDVTRLHRSMAATPRRANHTLAVLSKMFNLAEAWGLPPENSNPCRLVKRYPETGRERFLSEDELARLGATLDEAERESSCLPGVLVVIRLLALTGCRLGEVLRLTLGACRYSGQPLDAAGCQGQGPSTPLRHPSLCPVGIDLALEELTLGNPG